MIYTYPDPNQEIETGDIFFNLPFVVVNPQKIFIKGDSELEETEWGSSTEEGIQAFLEVRPAIGVVLTQNCDASRAVSISFFMIDSIKKVTGLDTPSEPKRFGTWLTDSYRKKNGKWYYLPEDEKVGFTEKMGVNFDIVFQVERKWLKSKMSLRKGRLDSVALEQFREFTSQYFRRYAYNEWYPLNKEEFEKYREQYPQAIIEPYPHQE